MKIRLLIIFFLFFISIINAQHIILKGKITNKTEVEGVHILNETSRFNTVSNNMGEFEIQVQIHDTLLFSSVNFVLKEIVITEQVYKLGKLEITLEKMINQLDEVIIGHRLTGNIASDSKIIEIEKPLNFDDVGIPGFKGIPKEKIAPIYAAAIPTSVNIEALYKHISGYYKKLKKKRKWTTENITIARIIDYYGFVFFEDAFQIPRNRLYDFLLFCTETTSLESDFNNQNLSVVLEIFKVNSKEYISRVVTKKE